MTAPIALSLPGGGLAGSLYQVGALAALEDGIEGVRERGFSLYVGQAGGSVVAACLAGGIPTDRIYRALLDPADNFFPLERRHILEVDTGEWQRTVRTAALAVRESLIRLNPLRSSNAIDPALPSLVLEQFDRLSDSMPAGLFTLSRFERFLADFYARRDIPNVFSAMQRRLRIVAHDLDSGERVLFGSEGYEGIPVSLACAPSCALPLFFSPVRIGGRHYIDGGLCDLAHLDVARDAGAEISIVVNPRVPVATRGAVPTGHGPQKSVRDKGLTWVMNQAKRISSQAMLEHEVKHPPEGMKVLVVEPEPSDGALFMNNVKAFDARRAILEYAYRTTRARISQWLEKNATMAERLGWKER